MSKDKKVDKFAGKGSLADRLRRRRQMMDSGDAYGAHKSMQRRKNNQSTDSSQ